MGETLGEGIMLGEHLAEIDGGTGEDALEVGSELDGDIFIVVIDWVKSGWETEVVQHRFDSFDSFR